MAFKRPTLVFVPGAWHSPSAFARTTKLLEGEGYKCIGVTLPSVRPGPPFEPNFDRDIASIRAAMTKEAEAGNDILLIMHSYAGIPGGAACEGLLKKPGEDGGVVGLVYISSLCGPIGFSVTRSDKLEENYGLSPWCKVDVRSSSILVFLPRSFTTNDYHRERHYAPSHPMKPSTTTSLSPKLSRTSTPCNSSPSAPFNRSRRSSHGDTSPLRSFCASGTMRSRLRFRRCCLRRCRKGRRNLC